MTFFSPVHLVGPVFLWSLFFWGGVSGVKAVFGGGGVGSAYLCLVMLISGMRYLLTLKIL